MNFNIGDKVRVVETEDRWAGLKGEVSFIFVDSRNIKYPVHVMFDKGLPSEDEVEFAENELELIEG
jgi:hypothetical protein